MSDTLAAVVKVAAVVVAYNRRDLLLEALAAILDQSQPLDVIHVVDNASSDDTSEMVTREFPEVTLHTLPTNTGGAGGFHAGIAFALADDADLIWLMDDDTVPGQTALADLVAAYLNYPGSPPSAVASRVLWVDGRDHPMNTPRVRPGVSRQDLSDAAKIGCVPVRSASFVSLLVDAEAVRAVGLPEAEFFLRNDDFEFSTRLLRDRVGRDCPASKVEHRTKTFGATDRDPGDRFYFEVRRRYGRSPGATVCVHMRRPCTPVPPSGDGRAPLRRPRIERFCSTVCGGGLSTASGVRLEMPSKCCRVPGLSYQKTRRRSVITDSTPFSLLLPTYHADDPDHLKRAFESAVDDQVLKPDEVVLVRDGVVPPRLQTVIDHLAAQSLVPVRVVALEQNIGLGHALDAGLNACAHEVVARMDADDISLPERFAQQIAVVAEGYDLVGSALLEFHDDEDDIVGLRTPPLTESEIRRWARFHDPFNHPTVVYRRSTVQAVGGYQDLPLMEDYWLFARMIDAGARVANVGEPLVKYRVGAGAYARRGGWQLLRSEIELQRQFRAAGFTTRAQYLRNLAVRGGYRLVPEAIRRVAYRTVIAPKGERDRLQPGG